MSVRIANSVDKLYDQVRVLEQVFEESMYAKVIMDKRTKIFAVNSAARNTFGIERSRKNQFLNHYLTKTGASRVRRIIKQLSQSVSFTDTIQLQVKSKTLHFEVSAHANIYKNYHFFTFQDITKKVLELESRNQFIAIAGHEIKTPLAVIVAYVDLLKRRCKDDKTAQRYLDKIQQKNKILQTYIEAIIDETKLGAGKMVYDDRLENVEKVLRGAIAEMQKMYPSREITVDIQNMPQRKFLFDKMRITQVIQNLISNALKHSSRRKPIEVSAHGVDGGVYVEVKDYGTGVRIREQVDIFKAFYRSTAADRKTPGLGLGLYISSKILDHYDSKLQLKSLRGQGATFYFELPYVQKDL